MKLSSRLQVISDLIDADYDHIWDTCCDHGLLGIKLLAKKPESTIHFVDVVPSIMLKLKHTLQQNPLTESNQNWKIHCQPVETINLAAENHHLIVIAGVGGDKVSRFAESIVENNPKSQFEFIVCPVHHHIKVRRKLDQLGFKLKAEKLVSENRRHYEVLYVAKNATMSISDIGESLWDFSDPNHREYLRANLLHFKQKANTDPTAYQSVFNAYERLANKRKIKIDDR